eukprot:365696-Chlamydomonas_euryale.AAC.8
MLHYCAPSCSRAAPAGCSRNLHVQAVATAVCAGSCSCSAVQHLDSPHCRWATMPANQFACKLATALPPAERRQPRWYGRQLHCFQLLRRDRHRQQTRRRLVSGFKATQEAPCFTLPPSLSRRRAQPWARGGGGAFADAPTTGRPSF